MSFPRRFWLPTCAKPHACDFEMSDSIGEGNFCSVYSNHMDGVPCAVKVISKNHVRRLHKEKDVLMEKHALSRLDHPRIVQLVSTWTDDEHCYIATELCSDGELWQSCKRCGEPEDRAKVLFLQIIEGLSYMHRMGIVHRDLKAENIFLTHKCRRIKIGDFGSSRDRLNPSITGSGNSSSSRGRIMINFVGTSNFLAPEALDNTENDELSDIWSLGCLFFQVLVGIPPFSAGSDYLVFLRMKANDLLFPSHGVSEEAKDLIRSVLKHNRTDRPSLDIIRQHSFFNGCIPGDASLLTESEIQLRSIARDDSIDLTDTVIDNLSQSSTDRERLRMAAIVREWEKKSVPGSGTAMLDHLNLPAAAFGQQGSSSSDSE